MLTCHREDCQDENRGSHRPKNKQLKEEVPRANEEGPERDVVERTGEQMKMGLKVKLVQCRGSGQACNTQIKTQEMTMAKEKGDLVLLDHINFIHV